MKWNKKIKNIYKGVERRLWTTLINSEVMTATLAPEEINGSGAIDGEFALESLIIEPGTDLWKEILAEEDLFLSRYMIRLFKLPRELKFHFILILQYSKYMQYRG